MEPEHQKLYKELLRKKKQIDDLPPELDLLAPVIKKALAARMTKIDVADICKISRTTLDAILFRTRK